MEVESFENEEIAKMLNDWFVSIKVVIVLYNDCKAYVYLGNEFFLPFSSYNLKIYKVIVNVVIM